MASGKQVGIGVAVAVVAIGAAYGVGRFQTSSKVDEAEQRVTAATSASASAVSSAQGALEVCRANVQRLEGRRALDLAILALDERNFGTAQERIGDARAFLASAKGQDSELAAVVKELESTKLVATDDIGDQRAKLIALLKRLDASSPPPKAP